MSIRKNISRQGNSGFTLLELTCALFVITVAGFGAIQLYNLGFEKIIEIGELDLATEVLRNELESARAVPFDELASYDGARNSTPVLEQLHDATVTVAVEAVSPTLKSVTATIRWQNRHGRWKTRSLATRIADRGVFNE